MFKKESLSTNVCAQNVPPVTLLVVSKCFCAGQYITFTNENCWYKSYLSLAF